MLVLCSMELFRHFDFLTNSIWRNLAAPLGDCPHPLTWKIGKIRLQHHPSPMAKSEQIASTPWNIFWTVHNKYALTLALHLTIKGWFIYITPPPPHTCNGWSFWQWQVEQKRAAIIYTWLPVTPHCLHDTQGQHGYTCPWSPWQTTRTDPRLYYTTAEK